jgi:hypothetical protein
MASLLRKRPASGAERESSARTEMRVGKVRLAALTIALCVESTALAITSSTNHDL